MTTSTRRRALVHACVTELHRVAHRYARNPNLDALLRDTGERTCARLADEGGIEVWLGSWPEGAETGWHDHGASVGVFALVSGLLVEETWETGAVRGRRLGVGDSRAVGGRGVHNVRGIAQGRSLTVHAYAPRLVAMTRQELAVGGPRPVETTGVGAGW